MSLFRYTILVRVLFLGRGWFEIVDEIRARLPEGATIEAARRDVPLVDQVAEADVLLPSNGGASAEVIARATRLELIQQPAVGVDGIALETAKSLGIPVCNAPGTNGDSVAEASLLLMLALARRLKVALARFDEAVIGGPLGVELAKRRLLLIGHGGSTRRLEAASTALGMSVSFVDSKSTREELLAQLGTADVISIHCPLTPSTRGMFDREAFAAMKRRAILINCARGPILDRAALDEALESGQLGGLGLDAYWEEPWNPTDPLFHRENVIALPHVAGSTFEAFARIASIVAENVRRCMTGEPLLNRIV
jgi:phosphoglycerate dehydrogenase-like enzyme